MKKAHLLFLCIIFAQSFIELCAMDKSQDQMPPEQEYTPLSSVWQLPDLAPVMHGKDDKNFEESGKVSRGRCAQCVFWKNLSDDLKKENNKLREPSAVASRILDEAKELLENVREHNKETRKCTQIALLASLISVPLFIYSLVACG